MKSTATHFCFNFILPIFFFVPYLCQPLQWDDDYLRRIILRPEMVASVENSFARFTPPMEAHPQLYGYTVLFSHFYSQLLDCTVQEEGNQVRMREECNQQLLQFLQDLGLLPERYRSRAHARREKLEEDWQNFLELNPPPVEPGAVMRSVEDHPVMVPPEQLPLLEGCPHLQLTSLPNGGGAATVSYSSLKNEFLRNQAVYATKVFDKRKFVSFERNRPYQRKRLLKLRAIYMMMVGQDLNAVMNRPNDANAANAANAAAADDRPNEDVGQNANDDDDDDVLIFENDHQMIPAPAVLPPDPVPNRQQLPWDDNHLRTVQITPQMVGSVNAAFTHFTQLMEAHPQLYGYVIFSHLYSQLWDCTDWEEENNYVYLSDECHAQLLTFLQDLGLLPNNYQSQNGRRRLQLEKDWQTFISVNPPPEQGPVMSSVAEHQVVVPPEQIPLLEGCPHLQLTRMPNGGDVATVSYRSLVAEFLRYQEVYATKEAEQRKFNAFRSIIPQCRSRLLKLKVIFMMMVGQDLEAAVAHQNLANTADETDFLGLNPVDFSNWPSEDE